VRKTWSWVTLNPSPFTLNPKPQVDAGCEKDLVLGDPNAPRFVFWEGGLRKVPGSLDPIVVIKMLDIWGLIRAGLGAVGNAVSAPN
jgi:hypothetical protein